MRPQAATFLRRNTFAVSCALIILVLVGGGWWLWHDLGKQEETLHVRTLQGEVELEIIATSPLLREALNQARTAVTRIESNLAVASNLADNLGYFYQLEEKTRTRLRGLNQLSTGAPAEDDRAVYKTIPYTMEVSGTYAQVMDFLQSLESGPRLVKIRSFSFRRADTSSGNVLLQLDLVVLGQA